MKRKQGGGEEQKKEREHFKNKPNEAGCSDCKNGRPGYRERERERRQPRVSRS